MIANIQEIIDDLAVGKMVVLVDDEERENEGDIVISASHITPEAINFMAQHCRGLICMAITKEHSDQLGLPMMATQNGSPFGTNFTVSIEAAQGVTTGISAADRAKTVQTAVQPNVCPSDIVMPGHVFPIRAETGGVLVRAGHTEAGCDLTRLAGLFPAAVICEIMNEDGSMARMPSLEKFADKHGIKIGTIESLIEHRMKNEYLVQREYESSVTTPFGEFNMIAYRDLINNNLHTALFCGELDADNLPLVRVAINATVWDGLLLDNRNESWGVLPALEKIAQEKSGVLLMLSTDNSTDKHRMEQQIAQWNHTQTAPNNNNLRYYGFGAQILSDLGCSKIRLLSHPFRLPSMQGFGLSIEDFIPPSETTSN